MGQSSIIEGCTPQKKATAAWQRKLLANLGTKTAWNLHVLAVETAAPVPPAMFGSTRKKSQRWPRQLKWKSKSLRSISYAKSAFARAWRSFPTEIAYSLTGRIATAMSTVQDHDNARLGLSGIATSNPLKRGRKPAKVAKEAASESSILWTKSKINETWWSYSG